MIQGLSNVLLPIIRICDVGDYPFSAAGGSDETSTSSCFQCFPVHLLQGEIYFIEWLVQAVTRLQCEECLDRKTFFFSVSKWTDNVALSSCPCMSLPGRCATAEAISVAVWQDCPAQTPVKISGIWILLQIQRAEHRLKVSGRTPLNNRQTLPF